MKTYRITGQDAIRLAERDALTLQKFADPIDGARTVTPSEARDIAREDEGLIYVEVQPTGWTSDETGYNVCDYFDHNGTYNGPDDDGVEPTWADVCEVSTDVSAAQDSIILRKRGFLPIANHRADRHDDSLTLWTNFRTGERAISTNGDPVFGGQAGYQHTLETCFPDVAAYSSDDTRAAFIIGFREGADILTNAHAEAHWAGFSNQLTDADRSEIEAGGRETGVEQGREYLRLFPETAIKDDEYHSSEDNE
jgi:hypothetical protein